MMMNDDVIEMIDNVWYTTMRKHYCIFIEELFNLQ